MARWHGLMLHFGGKRYGNYRDDDEEEKPLTQKQKELQWAYEKRKAARDNRKRGQEKEYAKENESMKSMSQAQRARLKTHGKENGDEGDDNDDDAGRG